MIKNSYPWSSRCTYLAQWTWVFTALALPLSVALTSIGFAASAILVLVSGKLPSFLKQSARSPIVWAILLLLLLVVGSMFYGTADLSSKLSFLKHYSKLLYIPLLLPLLQSDVWRERASIAFIAGVSVIAILTLLATLAHITIVPLHSNESGYHNHIAMSFMMAFAIYMCLFKCSLSSWRGRIYWLLVLIMSSQLFFVNTGRIGYLAFIILIPVFVFSRFKFKQSVAALCLFFLVGAAIYMLSPTLKYRVQQVASGIETYHDTNFSKDASTKLRLQFWQHSFELIKQKPWFGFGASSFQDVYFKNYGVPQDFSKRLYTPHNDYFNITVQMGLIGFAALLLLYIILLVETKHLTSYYRPAAFGLVISFAICANTGSLLYLSVLGHFLVYFICVFFYPSADKRLLNNDNNSR